MKGRTTFVIFLFVGCRPSAELPPPPLGDVRSAVLGVWTEDEGRFWASDLDAEGRGLPTFIADERQLVALLGYEEGLAWHGLVAGPQTIDPEGTAFAAPSSAFQLEDGRWAPAGPDVVPRVLATRVRTVEPVCDCRRMETGTGTRCTPCLAPVAPSPPAPPASPALPTLGPCPTGWQPSDEEPGVVICRPPGALDCGEGEAQFLGDAACAPLGPACGPGPFGPASGPAVYVDRAAALGGDGSEGAPFVTIAEAIAVAGGGWTILVGPGVYRENLLLEGVHIQGLCPARTVLIAPDPVTITSAETALSSLSIEGSFAVGPGAALNLYQVRLEHPDAALEVEGRATLVEVVVSGTRRRGIELRAGGRAHLQQVDLEPMTGIGVFVDAGANLSATDLRVGWSGTSSTGIDVQGGAVVADRLGIDGAEVGVDLGRRAVADLKNVFIEGSGRAGIRAEDSRFMLERAFMGSSRADHVAITTAPSDNRSTATATITDVVLVDAAGRGIDIVWWSGLRVRRALVARSRSYDVQLGGGRVTSVEDLTVHGVGTSVPGHESVILYGSAGSVLTRALIEDPGHHGLVVAGPATITDVTILRASTVVAPDTRPAAIDLRRSAARIFQRVLVDGAVQVGVALCRNPEEQGTIPPGPTVFDDLTIKNAETGLYFQCPGSASRALIEDTTADGVLVYQVAEPGVVLESLRVARAGPGELGNGAALRVRIGPARVSDALLTESGAGLRLGGQGKLSTSAVEISGNDVGVAIPSFFIGDDLLGALIRDNGAIYENVNLTE